MFNVKRISGIALASAAAGLFASAPAIAENNAEQAKVHCTGVNACKGKSDCKTASNACKGKNSCKGHGFVALTEKACKQIGGTAEK